jgi:transcriptional regulator of aromatic amino acid metabolism
MYLYTGDISFARIGEDRERHLDVSVCSPKSMYRLAHYVCSPPALQTYFLTRQIVQLQIDNLKELSLEGIKASLTVSNIVDETFSQITAK